MAACIPLAPQFLLFAETPRKSDAVILFLGDDFNARKRYAFELLQKGYAEYLFVPALFEVYRFQEGVLTPVSGHSKWPASNWDVFLWPEYREGNHAWSRLSGYPQYWENTHIEVLRAKEMMEHFGLQRGILVSSPTHMKRIRMICGRVLDNPAPKIGNEFDRFAFSPTPYKNAPGKLWFLSAGDLINVSLEYVKVAWFWLYCRVSGTYCCITPLFHLPNQPIN